MKNDFFAGLIFAIASFWNILRDYFFAIFPQIAKISPAKISPAKINPAKINPVKINPIRVIGMSCSEQKIIQVRKTRTIWSSETTSPN